MKAAMLDTDVLSEFLRGHPKVIEKVDEHLKAHGVINISIITYYEILNGLLYKDAKKQLLKFEAFARLNRIIPLTRPMAKKPLKYRQHYGKKGLKLGIPIRLLQE
jgi:tRNA(fMet)-specific endonuclease VapC